MAHAKCTRGPGLRPRVVGATANDFRQSSIRRAILLRATGCLGIGTDHRLLPSTAIFPHATACLRVDPVAVAAPRCLSIARMAFVLPIDSWRAIRQFPMLAGSTLGRVTCGIGKWHSTRL